MSLLQGVNLGRGHMTTFHRFQTQQPCLIDLITVKVYMQKHIKALFKSEEVGLCAAGRRLNISLTVRNNYKLLFQRAATL